MRVITRGLTFDVREGGPVDGPVALLLHGFPQHGGMWDGVVPALHAAGYRTYAPDQRGYSPGARPSDVDSYRMSECVLDAVGLLDALGVDRAHVLGHDWGAVVGWHLAIEHAPRVRSLTAVSVPHPAAWRRALRSDPDQRERASYMLLFAQEEGRAEEVLLREDAVRLRGMLSDAGPDPDRYVRPLLEAGALTGPLNWYRRLEEPPDGPALVATTLIWGREDRAIGWASVERCAEYVAPGVDYRFVPLDGQGHWLPDNVPDVIAREFLDRAGPA